MITPQHNFVAIITARGGSKRLKNKNILPMAGKPLITHTLDSAFLAKRFAAVVVTSDSKDILDIAENSGAHTIQRPAELGTDLTTSEEVLRHALRTIKENEICPTATDFVLLQPTSPLRTDHHIIEAIDIYNRLGLKSLASVVRCHHPPQKTLVKNADGTIAPLISWEALSMPRQLLGDAYQTNGAIYISDIKAFIETSSFFTAPFHIYEMTDRDSIDIDDENDFQLAERLMSDQK